ncbi:MAG: polysaccharide pyruvyl transferase family protein, partial [Clostridium sp.]
TEFINLFANAEKVITTSFHGTCFSILFEKDFYSLINSGREVRINNLLNKFKLTERMISNDLPISMENKKIDFSYSRTLLELEREKSKEFLLKITGTHNE